MAADAQALGAHSTWTREAPCSGAVNPWQCTSKQLQMPGCPCEAHSTSALTKGVNAHQGQGKVKHQRPCADSCRRNDNPLAAKVVASGDKSGLTKEARDEQPAFTQRCSAHSSAGEQHCVASTAPDQVPVTSCTWEWAIQGLQQACYHCRVSTQR